ncbi:hypothetical protein [Actinoplanes sp. NBRC 103695]|uniref:hypothetical protein n=1 Tax=Actinoplanes sp. NBRC 103695 TaxID=3032202 RepID=UPI00255680C6|nr:hypothetical protein [Actinoplanes sp. NBRC 103695]
MNSAIAATLHTTSGSYFVKALPTSHRWVWTQQREADIAPYLRAVAPALVDHLVMDDWDLLIFEALDGHHADYSPGSPDLPKILDLLNRISHTPTPDVELRDAAQRLADYTTHKADLEYFTGGSLLHTDWNNTNVIVGEQARIVDWGWATRGAPWLDAGYWIIWLIAAGHSPQAAEERAAHIQAWTSATPDAVTAFAAVNARLWADIGADRPDSWTRALVTASAQWQRHRSG